MERLVIRIGNEPAVPTEFDMDFAFELDKGTFDGLQRIFNQLCDLTDILDDDYDLDRLRKLAQADKGGKIKAYIADSFYCDICQKSHARIKEIEVYLTRDAAEAALRREQDG